MHSEQLSLTSHCNGIDENMLEFNEERMCNQSATDHFYLNHKLCERSVEDTVSLPNYESEVENMNLNGFPDHHHHIPNSPLKAGQTNEFQVINEFSHKLIKDGHLNGYKENHSSQFGIELDYMNHCYEYTPSFYSNRQKSKNVSNEESHQQYIDFSTVLIDSNRQNFSLHSNEVSGYNKNTTVHPHNSLYDIRDLYDNYFNQRDTSERFFNQIENAPNNSKFENKMLLDQENKSLESINLCVHSELECRKLIDMARKGDIGMVRRRLTEIEKKAIKPSSIFIYCEKDSGIKRWTDSRAWSPSRVLGPFLTYKELQGELYKKTFTLKFQDSVFHLVAYSLNEWDRNGTCCKFLNRKINKENIFKASSNELKIINSENKNGILRELDAGY